jgi:hypothetical protein
MAPAFGSLGMRVLDLVADLKKNAARTREPNLENITDTMRGTVMTVISYACPPLKSTIPESGKEMLAIEKERRRRDVGGLEKKCDGCGNRQRQREGVQPGI